VNENQLTLQVHTAPIRPRWRCPTQPISLVKRCVDSRRSACARRLTISASFTTKLPVQLRPARQIPTVHRAPRVMLIRRTVFSATSTTEAALRTVFAQLLTSAVVRSVTSNNAVTEEANLLASRLRRNDEQDSGTLASDLQAYCSKIALQAEDVLEIRNGLGNLLRLFVDNLSELTADDARVNEQLQIVRQAIDGNASVHAIRDTESFLQVLVSGQRQLRKDLGDAQLLLRRMVSELIERLGAFSQYSSAYGNKLEVYHQRIEATDSLRELNDLLNELLDDTQQMQSTTNASRTGIIQARDAVEEAEKTIRTLESDLAKLSEKVREDQLTGTLNRHGLQEIFARESSRAQRHNLPLLRRPARYR